MHVVPDVGGLGCLVITERTAVGLLSRVSPDVASEGVRLRKSLSAKLTHEGLFASVSPSYVGAKVTPLSGRVVAIRASEAFAGLYSTEIVRSARRGHEEYTAGREGA